MRVAIPLFGNDVAPRFGFADGYLIATIDADEIVSTERVKSIQAGWPHRMDQLKKIGVNVLLCGGCNRKFVPLAKNLGIQVVAGLTGDARQCAEAYARGEKMPEVFCNGDGGWGQQTALWDDRCKGRVKRQRRTQARNG